MRRLSCFVLVLCLLAACGSPRRSGPPAEEPETVLEAPVPVFSSTSIPDDVLARMRGNSYPDGARIALEDLRYLRLTYCDFEGNTRYGEMVCNRRIADDLIDIFRSLYEARYPIRSIRLVDDFGASDEASMAADNTSCFNYRRVAGSRALSKHAQGMAVDVNPLENPCVRRGGVQPAAGLDYADRERSFPHKIDRKDLCYQLFRSHGFTWGGGWRSVRDYQHFEK